MSNQNHPWSSDPVAQAAVRAAEDDAANWRRLEVGEVIEEGDEFLSAMDGRWRRTMAIGTPAVGSIAYRRRRVPPPDHRELPAEVADLRERVARLEDAIYRAGQFAAPEAQKGPNCTERESGLRTERVKPDWQRAKWDEALAIICDGGDWGRGNEFHPGSIAALMIWADREIAHLTAERDAAIRERDAASDEAIAHGATLNALAEARESLAAANRGIDRLTAERDAAREECERLRGRLATLEPIAKAHESAIKAAEKFNAEQAARAMADPESVYEFADAMANGMHAGTAACLRPIMHAIIEQRDTYKARVAELEAAAAANAGGEQPQPPRGWLTEEEHRAVEFAARAMRGHAITGNLKEIAGQLDALLARSTPPRVKVPSQPAEFTLPRWNLCVSRWIAAIRAAGGEVAE